MTANCRSTVSNVFQRLFCGGKAITRIVTLRQIQGVFLFAENPLKERRNEIAGFVIKGKPAETQGRKVIGAKSLKQLELKSNKQ